MREAGSGFVGLIGVQSNQFPRALDLARQFRAAAIPVAIGGFPHVADLDPSLRKSPSDSSEYDVSWAPAAYCIAHHIGGLDTAHPQKVCQPSAT